ncbi:MAG: phosphate ABC transporter permease PstA [Planctomycetota bacterium]|nr:phosphate ABC transporter permease PstA [Planctomycetota bacterium]
MRKRLRLFGDKIFVAASGLSVLLLTVALVLVLGPLLWRGAGAIVFRGTVEFRRMQYDLHGRGKRESLEAELAETAQARRKVYDLLDRFAAGIDTTKAQDQVRHTYRQFKTQLRNKVENGAITSEEASSLKYGGKRLRNWLLEVYETTNAQEANRNLDYILAQADDERLAGSAARRFFELAGAYRQIVATVDLARRQEYAGALDEVQKIIRELLGPRPNETTPDLAQFQYGATRWGRAQLLLDNLLWVERWVAQGPGKPLKKVRTRRAEQFAGTELAPLLPMVQQNLHRMLRPRRTFHWRYFIDDSTPGHFFGGVGPEILGTLLLTLLSMVFAIPLGVTAAGYLVECTSEGRFVRVIRTCINTLAGVPSIVFGLFGLAFFVLYLQPRLGLPRGSSILAGAMTLAVLVLPVLIRAAEEAIRAVPRSYKEASLALGAGKFRTFMTVTLPAAAPGILTGLILSMSRAAGETAPILFTAAVALGPIPRSLTQPTRTLSYGSYDIAVGDRLAAMVPHQQYGMVMTLIVLVLILNLTAIIIRRRLEAKLRGH